MMSGARYVVVVASLALGACAAPTAPFQVSQSDAPVMALPEYRQLTRAQAKANPPHPWVMYEDYEMEPTRFVFRPRNLPPEEHPGADDGGYSEDYGYYGEYGDFGGE
jgi:hypothetical protein